MPNKPRLKIKEQEENIFSICSNAENVLRAAGLKSQAREMRKRVMTCSNFNQAIAVVSDYINWE